MPARGQRRTAVLGSNARFSPLGRLRKGNTRVRPGGTVFGPPGDGLPARPRWAARSIGRGGRGKLRAVPLRIRPIAALATLGLYLMAAFLPCPPSAERVGAAAAWIASAHAQSDATPDWLASSGHGDGLTGHAGHGGEAGHDGHGAHEGHTRHAGGETGAHAEGHGGGHAHEGAGHGPAPRRAASSASPMPTPVAASASKPEAPRLRLRAPCLCGCSKTRALIGGGASRLGMALSQAPPTPLPEAVFVAAPPAQVRPPRSVLLPIDPIPI